MAGPALRLHPPVRLQCVGLSSLTHAHGHRAWRIYLFCWAALVLVLVRCLKADTERSPVMKGAGWHGLSKLVESAAA